MAKVTLDNVTSGLGAVSTINTNMDRIEAAMEKTLSRDGTGPNQMESPLDMNGHRIINLPDATTNTEPVTLGQAAKIAGVEVPFNRSTVGAVLYPITQAEEDAEVVPVDLGYEVGNVLRYSSIADAFKVSNVIKFPAGTHTLSAGITKTTTDNVTIIFEEGAIIDATGNADRVGIRLQTGDYDSFDEAALSSDVSAGDVIISSDLASELTPGDIIELLSTDLRTPNFDTVKGELRKVELVDGTDIYLDFPLYDSYTAATTMVKKIPMNVVRVQGMVMKRDGTDVFCLDVNHARYVIIDGGSFTGCQESQLRLTKCYGGVIKGVTAVGKPFTTVGPAGTNTQYGVVLLDCQNIKVQDSFCKAGRHGLSIGGVFPSRFIRICDNEVSNYWHDSPNPNNHALDVHAGEDYVWIERNVVHNGIMCRAANCWITDNQVFQNSDLTTPFNSLINVNTLMTGGNAVVRGNYLKATGATNQFGIRISVKGDNNNFESAIVEENVSDGVGTFFNVEDITGTGSSIGFIKLSGNSARNVSRLSVEVNDVDTIINTFIVDNNYLEMKGSIEMTGDFILSNNKLVASGSNRWDFGVTPAGSFKGNLSVFGNIFNGFSADGGLRVDCTYVDKLYVDDNNYSSGTTPGIVGHPRIHIATSRSAIGGVTAALNEGATTEPRYGLWSINDVVIKRDMAASGTYGWACTTAGYGIRGAWDNSSTYTVGQQVTNDGKLYRCVVAGTESGDPGPTHTSGEATTSGGVTWEFISSSFTQAVFKEFGTIAS